MRYLITTKGNDPFFSSWFDYENHFNKDLEMVVYDLFNCVFTLDGNNWHDIEIDHL